MSMSDAEFEKLLAAALIRANELDYEEIPSEEELHRIIQPSQRFLRRNRCDGCIIRCSSSSDGISS